MLQCLFYFLCVSYIEWLPRVSTVTSPTKHDWRQDPALTQSDCTYNGRSGRQWRRSGQRRQQQWRRQRGRRCNSRGRCQDVGRCKKYSLLHALQWGHSLQETCAPVPGVRRHCKIAALRRPLMWLVQGVLPTLCPEWRLQALPLWGGPEVRHLHCFKEVL